MPNENVIIDLYSAHEHSFAKRLKRSIESGEKEIHKLRVEIKNLRVLLEFLQSFGEKKHQLKALNKLLDPVFKKAGRIRTAQLNFTLTRVSRSAVMEGFKKHLLKTEKKASRLFLKEVKNFDVEKLKNIHKKNLKALKKSKSEGVLKETENYTRNIFSKIRSEMFNMNKDEVLHQIRKHLKTARTMGHLMSELAPGTSIQREIKKVAPIYEKIGKWHDTIVFINAFEKYLHKSEIQAVREKAHTLVFTLKEKNQNTKLLLIKKLKEDFV